MRPFTPTSAGRLTLCGYPIDYEAFGNPASPPILLLPAWQIVDRRTWKMQVAGFARSHYVITFDGPRLDRDVTPRDSAAFEYDRIVDQAVGLLDALDVRSAPVLGYSRGCSYALLMAARYPERVDALVLITNGVKPNEWASPPAGMYLKRDSYDGWEKFNVHYWQQDYTGWLEFLFGQVFSEPFSSKATEDCISWALEISPQLLAATEGDPALLPKMDVKVAIDSIHCPVLLIHGEEAQCTPLACTLALAEYRPDWSQMILAGGGQLPQVRDPVRVNREIASFLQREVAVGSRHFKESQRPVHASD